MLNKIVTTFDNPDDIIRAIPSWDASTPKAETGRMWQGDWCSQSKLNQFEIRTDGKGANGSRGYLALRGDDSNEFYIESTPYWWADSTEFDLRDTMCTFYLKELETLTVAPEFRPYLFISNHRPDHEYAAQHGSGQCGWFVKKELTVGRGEWAFNAIDLANDESQWTRYFGGRTLDFVLGHTGYIGVMYIHNQNKMGYHDNGLPGTSGNGVRATGLLGLDEFIYGPGMRKR